MIETSNSQEPVESTGVDAASTTETTENVAAGQTEKPEVIKTASIEEKMRALKTGKAPEGVVDAPDKDLDPKVEVPDEAAPGALAPVAPKFEANYKYKAFGKEKEVDEFWRPLMKDADSEKKVKEVFTRADAFDDMKGRYEAASTEGQKVLQQFTALDRDVKRVTSFLNKGDMDNFFQSLRISDDMLLNHLQRKAEIAKLSPMQQQAYEQGVNARAELYNQQESYEQMQSNYASQAVQARTMQLDMVMMRPEVQSIASAMDSKTGTIGAFRNLVIEEAAKHFYATKQDLPAEQAVQMTLNKFGKLLETTAPQAPVVPAQGAPAATAQAPQAPQTVVVQGKPVIPNVQGRGTSPVKQAPKSLRDLKKMASKASASEFYGE